MKCRNCKMRELVREEDGEELYAYHCLTIDGPRPCDLDEIESFDDDDDMMRILGHKPATGYCDDWRS